MRLLHFADLHLDTPFRWATPEVARQRRADLRRSLQRILELADDLAVDAVTCGGDLYEQERFTPDTASFLRDAFGSAGRPVLLAPGNHDWLSASSLYADVDWPGNVHVFASDRLSAYELVDGFTVWGAAHLAPANTDGFFDGFRVDRGGVNLGLFHGSERGGFALQEKGKTPHAPFTAQQVEQSGLAHALVGHFHRPSDDPWHTYPGSPDPLAFGTPAGAAVLATVGADGSVTRKRFDVSVGAMHDVSVHLLGAAHESEVLSLVESAVAGLSGVVRVTLTGDVSPDLDLDLATLAPAARHLDALVPRVRDLRVGYDLEAIAATQTVRGQFVRDVLSSGLDDDLAHDVVVTGLRALDGRADLAVQR